MVVESPDDYRESSAGFDVLLIRVSAVSFIFFLSFSFSLFLSSILLVFSFSYSYSCLVLQRKLNDDREKILAPARNLNRSY